MAPGNYLARIGPEAVITTTTNWYGAANVPGFVAFGQLDEFPYAELYFMNLQEVVADPSNPGDPLETMPAPDDLFAWFLEDTGAEAVGEPIPVEIDGYPGQQVDLRVDPGTPCAPRDERPFPQACLPVFPIGPDAFPFGPGMAYRLIVLPEVDGETVTILYSDDKDHFAERVQVAQAVVDSIDFVDPAASGEVAAAVTLTLGVARPSRPPGHAGRGALRRARRRALGRRDRHRDPVGGGRGRVRAGRGRARSGPGSSTSDGRATRVWDTFGVPSFQALQAPFLITDHGVLQEVLTDPIASEMLAGLEEAGFVGLGLYPDQLRHPLGYAAPLRSLDDFDGAAIRLVPSEATDALVRALGGEAGVRPGRVGPRCGDRERGGRRHRDLVRPRAGVRAAGLVRDRERRAGSRG